MVAMALAVTLVNNGCSFKSHGVLLLHFFGQIISKIAGREITTFPATPID